MDPEIAAAVQAMMEKNGSRGGVRGGLSGAQGYGSAPGQEQRFRPALLPTTGYDEYHRWLNAMPTRDRVAAQVDPDDATFDYPGASSDYDNAALHPDTGWDERGELYRDTKPRLSDEEVNRLIRNMPGQPHLGPPTYRQHRAGLK